MIVDVAVAGAGPAGLAVALEAARRGLSVAVFERRQAPVDKACGEGLMPAGVAALDRLGVLPLLAREDTAPFDGIAYVQEDGSRAQGRLPSPGGLGVRRMALAAAMTERAREAGVAFRESCSVRAWGVDAQGVTVATDAGEVRAQVLVAADGLHSPLRRAAGLERPHDGPRRFGLRRHVAMAAWSSSVEVHFARGAEAYVTPAGHSRVGVAFLWEDGALEAPVSFASLLARFPVIEAKIRGAAWDSSPRGAGPLLQSVTRRAGDRFVLAGDAAGYVDAITGEGLSLAFEGAAALGAVLPQALRQRATRASFAPYERAMRRIFDRYARLARLLVWTAARPALRRVVVGHLVAHPRLFDHILARVAR
jgi:2-polyprenyl-6-methoxyphenol hydroxylase-like FAD-dependent oxidoreductase